MPIRRIPPTAVVLSGGAGVRLRPITQEVPKGLINVGGKPMLQWVIEWLKSNGVKDIVIGVAYLKEKIIARLKDGHQFGVRIRYSTHTVDGGTGEGFRLAINRFVDDETFFALNGDQMTDLNLRLMFQAHMRRNAIATIGVVHPRLPFGLVKSDKDGYCKGFVEKPRMGNINCSAGIYVFQRDILPYLPERGDIEKTTLPQLTRKRLLRVFIHNGRFLTVNTIKELEEAERELKEMRIT